MNRYVVLYLAPQSVAERFAQATPAEAAKGMRMWADWDTRLGPALLDPGKPLGNARRITPTETTETSSEVIGMSILQATSMDEALKLVDNHHHLHWADQCEIVVLEEQPIPELQQ
ncbi:hypothetical protein ACFYTS_27805 [Nocardia sp. NPDC004151]|uniref:hypothetical protein n=1 Tax=Nocardia sp. NPDC004151 TaxID=3364304 RepID=UPI0036BB1CB8